MSIYYKYALDGSKIVVLSYVDDFVYWYTNGDLGIWFVDTLGKRFHVNFLEYAHWFMTIPFLWIRIDILLLLLQNNWILPQLR